MLHFHSAFLSHSKSLYRIIETGAHLNYFNEFEMIQSSWFTEIFILLLQLYWKWEQWERKKHKILNLMKEKREKLRLSSQQNALNWYELYCGNNDFQLKFDKQIANIYIARSSFVIAILSDCHNYRIVPCSSVFSAIWSPFTIMNHYQMRTEKKQPSLHNIRMREIVLLKCCTKQSFKTLFQNRLMGME